MEHRRLEPRPSSNNENGNGRVVVEGMDGERDMVFVPIQQQTMVDTRCRNMNTIRETLRTKLEQRPAKRQLVQRNILPACPLSSSAIGDRVRVLQRAQTGDVLRKRIEQRPPRQKLVTQHILVSEATVDALIAEKALRLERCRLVDDLKRKLQRRPGPLDLVDRHILVVKDQDGQDVHLDLTRTDSDESVFIASSPTGRLVDGMEVIAVGTTPYDTLSKPGTSSKSASGKARKKRPASTATTPYQSNASRSKLVITADSSPSGGKHPTMQQQISSPPVVDLARLSTNGNEAVATIAADSGSVGMMRQSTLITNRDETVTNSSAPSTTAAVDDEKSSYELLLKQQQLFLQWQQELQAQGPPPGLMQSNCMMQNHPCVNVTDNGMVEKVCVMASGIVPPASSSSSSTADLSTVVVNVNDDIVAKIASSPNAAPPRSSLADWRVPELRNECKKRQMIVSGAKPILLERLRPYEATILAEAALAAEQPPLDPTPPMPCQQQSAPLPPICDVIGDYCALQQTQQKQSFIQIGPGQQQNLQVVDTYRPTGTPCRCGSGLALDASRSSSSYSTPSSYSSPGIHDAGGSMQSAVVPEATFSFAQMGSGGQFTLAPCSSSSAGAAVLQQPHREEPTCEQHVPVVRSPAVLSTGAVVIPVDSMPTAVLPTDCHESLLSATQLSMHEEMLRHQQRKVEQLQLELQRSQQQLRHQQHVIMAAKKAQSRAQCGAAEQQSVADLWLAQLDTKHLHKFHIQLFLQHKLQQQQMQEAITEHEELCKAEQRLAEELHVEQAVKDIVRLIKQDARTALLIVQLLRRYQIERQQERIPHENNGQHAMDTQHHHHHQQQMMNQQHHNDGDNAESSSTMDESNGSTTTENNARPCSKSSKKKKCPAAVTASRSSSSVDMEEIFRTVLQDATRAIQEDCNAEQSTTSSSSSHNSIVGSHAAAEIDNGHDDEDTSPKNIPTPEYHYSSNVEIDDLMDVLRDDQEKSNSPSSSSGLYNYGAPYGSDELNQFFGDDWASGQHDVDLGDSLRDEPVVNAMDALQNASGTAFAEQNMDWLLNEFMLTSPSDPLECHGSRLVHNPLLSQTHIDATAFAV